MRTSVLSHRYTGRLHLQVKKTHFLAWIMHLLCFFLLLGKSDKTGIHSLKGTEAAVLRMSLHDNDLAQWKKTSSTTAQNLLAEGSDHI